jgi:hypothetical protein
MANSNVLVNDTVRIKVKFVDKDPLTGSQTEVSPLSVSVTIFDSNNVPVSPTPTSAVQITSSQYYYDFIPNLAGEYKVTFVGTLPDSKNITVNQALYVSTPTEEYKPTITLKADETIAFAPSLRPLYIDPETIKIYFPDVPLLEIGELIHGFSHEVNTIFGIMDPNLDPTTVVEGDSPNPVNILSRYGINPYTVFEYIQASVLCRLTKIYGFGGDDELSLELGDFKVTNRNTPRSNITRANATTWCQVAAALRKEIIAKKVGLRSVLPKGLPIKSIIPSGGSLDPEIGGLIYINDTTAYGSRDLFRPGTNTDIDPQDPMPDRNIKRYD